MSKIYKLKFLYKRTAEDGTIEKAKTEVFAECVTYAEAEELAFSLIERDDMNRIEECDYEIVKTKFNSHDFLDNKTLRYDEKLINGKVEHYFADDNDAFFIIKVKLITIDEKTGKEHRIPAACVISDRSMNHAVASIKDYLSRGMMDFIITDTKMDAADAIYLSQESHTEVIERYEAKA